MICCECGLSAPSHHVCPADLSKILVSLNARLSHLEAVNAWYSQAAKAGAYAPYTYGSVMCGGCHESLEVNPRNSGFRQHDCPARKP